MEYKIFGILQDKIKLLWCSEASSHIDHYLENLWLECLLLEHENKICLVLIDQHLFMIWTIEHKSGNASHEVVSNHRQTSVTIKVRVDKCLPVKVSIQFVVVLGCKQLGHLLWACSVESNQFEYFKHLHDVDQHIWVCFELIVSADLVVVGRCIMNAQKLLELPCKRLVSLFEFLGRSIILRSNPSRLPLLWFLSFR